MINVNLEYSIIISISTSEKTGMKRLGRNTRTLYREDALIVRSVDITHFICSFLLLLWSRASASPKSWHLGICSKMPRQAFLFHLTHPAKPSDPISKSSISYFAHQYVVFSTKIRMMNRPLSYTPSCNLSQSMVGGGSIYRHFGWFLNAPSSSLQ